MKKQNSFWERKIKPNLAAYALVAIVIVAIAGGIVFKNREAFRGLLGDTAKKAEILDTSDFTYQSDIKAYNLNLNFKSYQGNFKYGVMAYVPENKSNSSSILMDLFNEFKQSIIDNPCELDKYILNQPSTNSSFKIEVNKIGDYSDLIDFYSNYYGDYSVYDDKIEKDHYLFPFIIESATSDNECSSIYTKADDDAQTILLSVDSSSLDIDDNEMGKKIKETLTDIGILNPSQELINDVINFIDVYSINNLDFTGPTLGEILAESNEYQEAKQSQCANNGECNEKKQSILNSLNENFIWKINFSDHTLQKETIEWPSDSPDTSAKLTASLKEVKVGSTYLTLNLPDGVVPLDNLEIKDHGVYILPTLAVPASGAVDAYTLFFSWNDVSQNARKYFEQQKLQISKSQFEDFGDILYIYPFIDEKPKMDKFIDDNSSNSDAIQGEINGVKSTMNEVWAVNLKTPNEDPIKLFNIYGDKVEDVPESWLPDGDCVNEVDKKEDCGTLNITNATTVYKDDGKFYLNLSFVEPINSDAFQGYSILVSDKSFDASKYSSQNLKEFSVAGFDRKDDQQLNTSVEYSRQINLDTKKINVIGSGETLIKELPGPIYINVVRRIEDQVTPDEFILLKPESERESKEVTIADLPKTQDEEPSEDGNQDKSTIYAPAFSDQLPQIPNISDFYADQSDVSLNETPGAAITLDKDNLEIKEPMSELETLEQLYYDQVEILEPSTPSVIGVEECGSDSDCSEGYYCNRAAKICMAIIEEEPEEEPETEPGESETDDVTTETNDENENEINDSEDDEWWGSETNEEPAADESSTENPEPLEEPSPQIITDPISSDITDVCIVPYLEPFNEEGHFMQKFLDFEKLKDNWYMEGLEFFARWGILQGEEDDNNKSKRWLNPQSELLKSTLAVTLMRTFYPYDNSKIDYDDFDFDKPNTPDWSKPHVVRAIEQGLLEESFDGYDEATRMYTMELLIDFMELDYENIDTSDLDFKDLDKLSDKEKKIVAGLEGIVKGNDQGYLNPDQVLNRAEIFTMLYRAYELDKIENLPYGCGKYEIK